MHRIPLGVALCGEDGLPCGHAHPAYEAVQQKGVAVAVGRGSVPIPDANLLRDTNSVCGDSGVPAPQTKDLSNVTFAKADASPTGNSGDGGWKEPPNSRHIKVATAQVREPRSWGALLRTSLEACFSALSGPS